MSVVDNKATTISANNVIIAENEQKVYDAGVKSEYDRFWDVFQDSGNRTDYMCAFGGQWTASIFKPKYPVRPTNAYMLFYNNQGMVCKIEDFVEHCEKYGIVLDFSQCTNCQYCLGALATRHFGTLDFSKATNMNNIFYGQTFGGSWFTVRTIDNLVSSATTAWNANTFQYATNLTDLTMSGVIATNNFNVSYCTNLTHDSLMSILNVLAILDSGVKRTVTLGATNLAKLTDTEKAIATEKGWTLA